MHSFKDKLFEKSQQKLEQNQKMHYLLKNLQALNKLDKWTHLFTAFKEQRELDPWYPVPVLENPKEILIVITEPSVSENIL